MKTKASFNMAVLPLIVLGAIALTLSGCLITGETMGGSGLLLFGSVSIDSDHGNFAVPQTPQRHIRAIRIATSYPVQVYRVVLIYQGGFEQSYAVNWWFTDRIRYHDLRLANDKAVREIRIYQRMPGPSAYRHDRGKRKGSASVQGNPAGPVSFTFYGLQ